MIEFNVTHILNFQKRRQAKRKASDDLKIGTGKPKYLILQMPNISLSPTQLRPCNIKQSAAQQSSNENKVEPETPSGFDIREFLKVDTPTADDVNSKSRSVLTRQDSVTTLL